MSIVLHVSNSCLPEHVKQVIFLFSSAAIEKYKPTDATTNPSLILQASQKTQYDKLIDDAVAYAKENAK